VWDVVLTYILPFLIFFTILYAFFQRVNIFADPKKSQLARKMNIFLSIIIAVLVLVYKPLGFNWGEFLSKLFGANIFLIIGLVFFLFFTIMFSAARMEFKPGAVSLVVGLILASLALMNAGIIEVSENGFHIGDVSIEALIILGAVLGIFYGMFKMFSSKGEKYKIS
jgi:integral membrane sensor domain MASE1